MFKKLTSRLKSLHRNPINVDEVTEKAVNEIMEYYKDNPMEASFTASNGSRINVTHHIEFDKEILKDEIERLNSEIISEEDIDSDVLKIEYTQNGLRKRE